MRILGAHPLLLYISSRLFMLRKRLRSATRRHVPEGSSLPLTHCYNAVRLIPATDSPLFRETAAAVLRAPHAVLEVVFYPSAGGLKKQKK